MSGPADDSHLLLGVLTVLTAVSGLVDAVSYLGLGHVFAANMTGNVVVLGFAAAGAPGFSMVATATSIGSFLVGAVVAGRLGHHVGSRRHWFLAALVTEAACVGAAAVVAAVHGTVGGGAVRYAVIGLLGFAMGLRNSTVRRMGVPDVTTTVLTMTLTGLASDSTLAGGTNPHAGRRTSAVVAMFVGALVGAALLLHQGADAPLAVAAGLVAVAAVVFAVSPASRVLDADRR
jgi:uncharacterized membrane protein YoaK (UPF0700 family)